MSKKVLEAFYQTEAEAIAAIQGAALNAVTAKKIIVREMTLEELTQEKRRMQELKKLYKAKSTAELKAEKDRLKKEYDIAEANLTKLKTL